MKGQGNVFLGIVKRRLRVSLQYNPVVTSEEKK